MGCREEVFLLVIVVMVVVAVGTCCWNLLLLLELVWVVLGCKPKLCDEAEAEAEHVCLCACVHGLQAKVAGLRKKEKKPWA